MANSLLFEHRSLETRSAERVVIRSKMYRESAEADSALRRYIYRDVCTVVQIIIYCRM